MRGKKKILIVDDQVGIRALLKLALGDYQIKEVATGEEAKIICKEWQPDLLIIDMKLPGLNGVEVVKNLNKLGIYPQVLLMTAYAQEDVFVKDVKIAGFLEKPFDLDVLNKKVEKLLEI